MTKKTDNNLTIEDKRDFWFVALDICVMRDRSLSFYSKGIYAILAAFTDMSSRAWSLKVSTLAEEAGISERQVRYALKELEEHGYIEREKRHLGGRQRASRFHLVGHKAQPKKTEEPIDAEQSEGAADQNTDCTTCSHQTAPHAERITISQSYDTTLSEGAEAPIEPATNILDTFVIPDPIPKVMIPTVQFLLLKTGRKALLGDEVGAVMALEKKHMPARIQNEIMTAVKRFERLGRPRAELTFAYIFDSMKHQPPTKAFRNKNEAPAVKEAPQKTEEELEYERMMAERFGGEASG